MSINDFPRVVNAVLFPVSIVTIDLPDVAEAIVGVAATPFAILACGRSEVLNEWSKKTFHVRKLISNQYRGILKIINPGCRFDNNGSDFKEMSIPYPFTEESASTSGNFFKRHIFKRACYALGVAVAPIVQVANLAIGLTAASLSILTLGKFWKINRVAKKNLAFDLIEHVCVGTRFALFLR